MEAVSPAVELRHAVPLGIVDPVSEYGCLFFRFGGAYCPCQQLGESGPLEDVVPEYEAYGIVADKFLADQERLREPVGRRLFGIREMYPHNRIRRPAAAGKRAGLGVEITRISRIPASIKTDSG